MTAMAPDPAAATPLLRHRPFLYFLYVRVVATIALQIQVVAVGWQMYELTGSPLHLGLIGLVQFIPAILFPFTGHVADRYDRRRVVFIAESIEALAVGVLSLANGTGRLTPDLLLAMAFIVGTGRAFEQPSLQSMLTNIVPASALPRAIAASTSAAQTAVVAGPALGGILVAFDPTLVFAVCAVLWLSAGLVMLGIATSRVLPTGARFDWSTLFSGIAFIVRNKVVLAAVLLDLFAVLFGNAIALLPVFTRDIFHTGPLGFGLLRAAPAAGAIVTALVLTRRPISGQIGKFMFGTVAMFGIGTILLALSPSFIFAIGALVIIGVSDVISVVIRQTMVQLRTPDDMRGRVYAVNSLVTITSNQLGDFRAGAAASLFGTIPAVLIGGCCTLVVVLIFTQIFGELYHADNYERAKP